MFEIIKNTELPPLKAGKGGVAIYPFAAMEVGDGFDAPRDMGEGKTGADRRRNSIGVCANRWAKRHNPTAKFTTRLLNDDFVRCVRIA